MRRRDASVWAVLLFWSTGTVADDHLLTIGGGPVPTNNQVSLEKNVSYLQRVLGRLDLEDTPQTILFSDGGEEERDLQYDAQRDPEDVRMLLGEILGPNTGMKYNYRSSILPIVDGAATPQQITSTLEDLAAQLHAGDRLIIYFTGHGGRARGAGARDRRHRSRESARPSSPEATPESASADSPSTEKKSEKQEPDSSPEQKPEAETSKETESKSAQETSPSENDRPDDEKAKENEKDQPNSSERPADRAQRRRIPFANNILHLWNGSSMSVTEWTQKLDALPPDVPVVAIMVQCYSGGFGNFIFAGGNPQNGIAEHSRCGFFSTVPDRVAAGCTPNVNEADYREYSSYFFEALSGESRTGERVKQPDYDNDGRTSLLEAHAYTVLNADTIDIPVRTADVYLRCITPSQEPENRLTSHSSIDLLLANSSPIERAVVEGLSNRFELHGEDRAKEVEEAIRKTRGEKQKIDGEATRHRQTVTTIRKEIGESLKKRWPELASPWHPESARLVSEEPEVLLDAIRSHKRYDELRSKTTQIESLTAESEQKELQVVKLERLQYWLETLAMQANLKASNDEQANADFQRLVELESSCVTKATPPGE